jgi:hypothetical protein
MQAGEAMPLDIAFLVCYLCNRMLYEILAQGPAF